MMIKEGDKVSIAFTLKDEQGHVWDEHTHDAPFVYTQGKRQLMSFIEESLLTKKLGDKVCVEISPEQGYGPRDEKLVSTLDKEHFKDIKDLQKGMHFNPSLDPNISFVVVDINESTVTVDANHPLAGKILFFDIEVLKIN
jgi:FKBP-type peptidyl-prolyl cis-trans isomerase SlyD